MHGINEAYGVPDSRVAIILGNNIWPAGQLIEWDDEAKNKFMTEYFQCMDEMAISEVQSESAYGCHPGAVSRCFTDPLKYASDIAETLYIYMERDVQEQIERARKLIYRANVDDARDGLKFAARG